MPRPGPRPYECVRRAWHSDRHQPMRGSLIQEIFRVVNEIHNSQTKKNKEWQEKLPVVVFKAEEIMYSKANSEAEYMDLQTLWERTNDAIDTIIRKEDTTESGELLQPCIEAALILGCTPRRASRSQRNSYPRSYLTPNAQEPAHVHRPVPDNVNVTLGGSSRLAPLHPVRPASTSHVTPYYSITTRPNTTNSTQLCLETSTHTRDDSHPRSNVFPLSSQNLPPSSTNPLLPSENLGRVYPLYFGTTHHQITEPQMIFQHPHGPDIASPILATSQNEFVRKPEEQGFLQNFFSIDGLLHASSRNAGANITRASQNPSGIECDLSLQLGPLSEPCASTNSRCTHEVEDIRSSSSREGSKSSDPSTRISKEFCFFPTENVDSPLDSSSSKWSSKRKAVDLDASTTKQKAPVSNSVEAGHLSQPKFSPDLFFGRMKEPDK